MFEGISSVDLVHARAVNDRIGLMLLHAVTETECASLTTFNIIV